MSALRVGIFGGTFNPIHLGHLLLAETARDALRLDRVLFIPAGQPPHKRPPGLLDGAVRLRMVRLAIKDHPAFAASDIELQRSGPSYSIDTVTALHRALPEAALFLLIGQDMLAVRWAAWNTLKRLCTVAAVRRPGSRRARMRRGIRWLDMPPIDIASSDIRARVAAGRSIRYLVPAAVERYIRRQRLYEAAEGTRP
jgi:nicotinate-nucleotide adenylyltransferase